MKRLTILVFFIFTTVVFCQNNKQDEILKITQGKCISKKGYHLQLKKVVNDSRCPEGVNCIWAGETEVIVAVYQNKKFVKDHTLIISSKNVKENLAWFSSYYPNIKISKIDVFPIPKDGVVITPKKYLIKIIGKNKL